VKREVRQRLEQTFRSTLDRNVSLLAADYCKNEELAEAATLCETSHESVSKRLWSKFSFDWSHVQENPGGTSGRMSKFVAVKLEYTVAWAVAEAKETVEVVNAEKAALEALYLLWLEWAGYMVTTSEDYARAIGE
jgi:hypothetical protein